MDDLFARLAAPFSRADLNWRIIFSGKKGNGDIYAAVSAYVDRSAIVRRLDEVCGPAGWQVRYESTAAHLHAGIGIWVPHPEGGEWIWKWDGAGHAESRKDLDSSDAGKSDHTHALKRTAWVLGIGRYLDRRLYGIVHKDPSTGRFRAKLSQDNGGDRFSWDPPELPAEMLPAGSPPPEADPATGELGKEADELRCPSCGGPVYDNTSKGPKWPDLRCKKGCGWEANLADLRAGVTKATNEQVARSGMKDSLAARLREAAASSDPLLILQARAYLVELGAWGDG